jgi:predicted RNase H-like nuclease (RuvC/YqgF family)
MNTPDMVNALPVDGECSEVESSLNRLLGELEVETVEAGLEAIRNLKAHASATPSPSSPDAVAVTNNELVDLANDPRILLEKLRAFASKIDSLNGTISSMESQLQSLYADRERLESEIGASEVEDVILAFGDLQTTISLMEKQLMTMYAGREVLEVELGRSDPQEIVAMFRTVTNLIAGAHQELEIPVK